MKYNLRFDFDADGEPPKQFIYGDQGDCIEVMDEPSYVGPLDTDWEFSDLAKKVLALLRNNPC